MPRKQKMKKIQPAVQRLAFTLPLSGTNYIDLSKVCSAINRRFYRQGLNWAVGAFRITGQGTMSGTTTVSKLPNSWAFANGWEKVFRAWQRQQDDALEDGTQESVKARYNDFKIYMDADMLTATTQTDAQVPLADQILLPHDNDYNLLSPGQWDYSNLVIPNFGSPGNNFDAKIFGVGPKVSGIGGGYSIIQLYADSRSTPFSPDPDVPADVLGTDNILNLMFDVGDNNREVLTDAVGENNETPYDVDNYPGGDTNFSATEVVGYAFINNGTNTATSQATIPGSNFPCGLIRIDSDMTGGAAFYNLIVDLVPGHHRGYLAEPMTEM